MVSPCLPGDALGASVRKGRPRYPRPQDVMPVKAALEVLIPMDTDIQMGLRESEKLVPNIRLKSQTNEISWYVDIYSGQYYVVSVNGYSEICKSIQSIVGFLCRMLGVKPKSTAT